MRTWTSFTLSGVVAVTVGCQGLPPDSRMEEGVPTVPGSWAATKEGQAGIDSEWVDRFKDRKLSALVEEALVANPDLRAAEARVRQAASNAILAGADRKPMLNAGLNGQRQQQNFIGFPFGSDPSASEMSAGPQSNLSNAFGASLDLSWELDVWGRIRAGESAAISQSEAVEQDYRAARASLVAQVAKAYFALAEAQEQVTLSNEIVAAFQQTEETIRQRFELGQNDEGSIGSDLRLAMSDVATARAGLEESLQLRASAVRQLETLLGRYPAGEEKAAKLPDVPAPPPPGLPSGLLQRRPDVLAAERRFAAQGKRISEANRALFPQISLTGSAGRSAEEIGDLLDSEFGVWSLAGGLVQPILTGGQIRGNIELRRGEEAESLADLQSTVLQAFSEVEVALATDAYLARREASLREAESLAREAYVEAQANYRNAVGDVLSILAAQNQAVQSARSVLGVRRLRLDNRVNLHLALGGDYRAVASKDSN